MPLGNGTATFMSPPVVDDINADQSQNAAALPANPYGY